MKLLTAFTTLFLSFSFFSYSQLTEASAEVSIEAIPYVDENGESGNDHKISAVITVNDIDFFGEAVVTVLDATYEFPLKRQKVKITELQQTNKVNGNSFSIEFSGLPEATGYKIIFDLRDFQGNHLPEFTHNL